MMLKQTLHTFRINTFVKMPDLPWRFEETFSKLTLLMEEGQVFVQMLTIIFCDNRNKAVELLKNIDTIFRDFQKITKP